jgi:hypothetical protein
MMPKRMDRIEGTGRLKDACIIVPLISLAQLAEGKKSRP